MENEQYEGLTTTADAVREYVWNVGQEQPDRQYILSPYDSWEKNPHYKGPPQPHPEDDEAFLGEGMELEAQGSGKPSPNLPENQEDFPF